MPPDSRPAPGSATRYLPWVLLVVAVGLFVWHSSSTQFLQDDSYITYRYTRNIARGHGPVFNVGERVEGYTNFLWMMLLAALGIAGVPFTTIIPLSQILGVICGIGVLILFFLLVRRHSTGPPNLTPFAVLLLAANGSFAYWCVSGMESGLFSLLFAAGLYVYLSAETTSGSIGASVLLGLAALTRPEGALFLGLVVAHFVLRRLFAPVIGCQMSSGGRAWRRAFALLVPFVVLVAPLYVWRLGYYGYFFPNTFYAKTGLSSSYLKSGIDYLVSFYRAYGFWGLGLLFPLAVVVKYRSRAPLPALSLALLVIVVHALYTVSVGGDVLRIHRFFVPVYLLYYFILAEGLWLLKIPRPVVPAILSGLAVLTFWGPFTPGKSVRREINHNKYLEKGLVQKMKATGLWLNANLSEQDWFCCTTIGAVGYFSDRNLVDMLGLTDAIVAHEPENILGPRVYWKERNYNTRHVLERNPVYIYFSTGGKPSAAAERALFLRTRFRQGYFPCPVSVVEGGQIYSDVLFKRRPGAESLPIETPGVNPEFVDLYNLGINLARPQKYDSSLATFRRCNQIAPPDFAYAYEWIGQIQLSLNQEEPALENLYRAISIDDWCITAHQLLGSIYYQRRQYDSAAVHFGKVVRYAPDYFEGYVNVSAALNQTRDFAAAETALLAGTRRFPAVPDLVLRLAYVRMMGGNLDAAEQDLNAILARSPGHREALGLLEQVRRRRSGPGQP